MTNLGVFAGGDTKRGASLIVWAIAEGRKMAAGIDKYLYGRSAKSRREHGQSCLRILLPVSCAVSPKRTEAEPEPGNDVSRGCACGTTWDDCVKRGRMPGVYRAALCIADDLRYPCGDRYR